MATFFCVTLAALAFQGLVRGTVLILVEACRLFREKKGF